LVDLDFKVVQVPDIGRHGHGEIVAELAELHTKPYAILHAPWWWGENQAFDLTMDDYVQHGFAVGRTALLSRVLGSRYVLLSEPDVFGTPGGHDEAAEPKPASYRGMSSYLAERAAQALQPKATVVRGGWLYGTECVASFPYEVVREWVTSRSPRMLYVDDHEMGRPLYADDVADQIIREVLSPTAPIVHLTTEDEPMTWYEFLVRHHENLRPYSRYEARRQSRKKGPPPIDIGHLTGTTAVMPSVKSQYPLFVKEMERVLPGPHRRTRR
jgi:dTDP-4-dehydrorhamnose reductase